VGRKGSFFLPEKGEKRKGVGNRSPHRKKSRELPHLNLGVRQGNLDWSAVGRLWGGPIAKIRGTRKTNLEYGSGAIKVTDKKGQRVVSDTPNRMAARSNKGKGHLHRSKFKKKIGTAPKMEIQKVQTTVQLKKRTEFKKP